MSDEVSIAAGLRFPPWSWRLITQMATFAAVGGAGLLVDVGVFNLLRATVLSPDLVPGGSLWSKVISVGLATLVNWVGNRMVTFRHQRRRGSRRAVMREASEFAVASILGSCVALICLAVSHYALDLRTAADDNVSANVIGLALGTVLRFVLYRWWVFRHRAPSDEREVQDSSEVTRMKREYGAST